MIRNVLMLAFTLAGIGLVGFLDVLPWQVVVGIGIVLYGAVVFVALKSLREDRA